MRTFAALLVTLSLTPAAVPTASAASAVSPLLALASPEGTLPQAAPPPPPPGAATPTQQTPSQAPPQKSSRPQQPGAAAAPPPPGAPAARPAARPEPPTTNSLQALRRRGTLRACVALYAPWVMADKEGVLSGFSVDIAEQLAADLEVDLAFVQTSYPELIPSLSSGECDVIPSGLAPTIDRALFVHFSQPTALHDITVVTTKAPDAKWSKTEDLDAAGVTIGAVAGSAELQDAKRIFPKATVQEIATPEELGTALAEGKVNAVIAASPLPALFVKTGGGSLVRFDAPVNTRGEAFAVRRGDLEFLAYLNTWIQAHTYDGWLPAKRTYWFEQMPWLDTGKR